LAISAIVLARFALVLNACFASLGVLILSTDPPASSL